MHRWLAIRVLFIGWGSVIGCGLLGASASAETRPFCPPPSVDAAARTDLLGYFNWLLQTSAAQRKAQYDLVRAQVADQPTPRAKLVLALLLCVPETPFVDYPRARTLVSDFISSQRGQDKDDIGLAQLLRVLLAEVDKSKTELERLGTKLQQLQEIEKDISHTEQSVNVPAPSPAPVEHERKEEHPSGR
ncbi:MAG: hypothetical protein P8Y27_04310 [Chromatiaceae bacterium]|jgi:hypothetical protein